MTPEQEKALSDLINNGFNKTWKNQGGLNGNGRVTEHHLGPSAWHNPLIIMTIRMRQAWDAVDDPALDG
jgi:hypothetical protein